MSVLDIVSYKCENISLVNIATYSLKMFDFIFQALDKKGIGHLGEKELKERNKQIQEENRRELQKAGIKCIKNLMLRYFGVNSKSLHVQVKQLRLEREREKAMRETELEMLQREKEAEHFKTWAEQEDNFHLQQAKLR